MYKHRYIITTLLVVLMASVGVSKAQDTEPDTDVGTLEKAWAPVIMEHSVGIRGGLGSGSERFQPVRQSIPYPNLLNFGLVYRFDAPAQKYVGCIEINLNYMEKGFQYETYSESGIVDARKYSIIELPILWQPYLPLSRKNPQNRIYLSAGPYVGYTLRGEYRKYHLSTDETIESGEYIYTSSKDNRFEYGIVAGGGIQISYKRIMLSAEFRYNIMLSNVLVGAETYLGNPMFSPVDQMSISAGVYYRFTDKQSKKAKINLETDKK